MANSSTEISAAELKGIIEQALNKDLKSNRKANVTAINAMPEIGSPGQPSTKLFITYNVLDITQ